MPTTAIGERFNPWRRVCGFYVPDVVGRQRKLMDAQNKKREVTDGHKRLYERLVRYAGQQGKCWPSQVGIADELGKSDRQIRKDLDALESFRLIERERKRGLHHHTTYFFLWHDIFDLQRNSSSAVTDPESEMDGDQNGTPVPLSNGTPVPFFDEGPKSTTELSSSHNGTGRSLQRNCSSDEFSKEFSKGIQSSSSGSSQLPVEEEEEFLSSRSRSPNQKPDSAAIVHSPEDIETLQRVLQDFMATTKGLKATWQEGTLRAPSRDTVEQICGKAPGWTVMQIAQALTENATEHRSKPESYAWFLPVVADIYQRRHGVPPVPERAIGLYRSWDECAGITNGATLTTEPKCSHCRDKGEFPAGEDCKYGCEASEKRKARRMFDRQSERWNAIYDRYRGTDLSVKLDLSGAGMAFHLGTVDERENVLAQLEAGGAFDEVVSVRPLDCRQ